MHYSHIDDEMTAQDQADFWRAAQVLATIAARTRPMGEMIRPGNLGGRYSFIFNFENVGPDKLKLLNISFYNGDLQGEFDGQNPDD